ncbi:MAG TPA: HAD family hydrolase [Rhabdochlamydiaceae bacterium]|nr:HAD family hydrolase [Rhabdochlamydiaceae bacterium]
MDHKGWIALDIDGTLTAEIDSIPLPVIKYLEGLVHQGWNILILTGRALSYFNSIMRSLTFPYYLAIQNGADILKMPEKKLLNRQYLTTADLRELEKLHLSDEDMIIYSGYEHGDFCYFRPHKFSEMLLEHLDRIEKDSPKPWKQMESFDFSEDFCFPLVKCFGHVDTIRKIEIEVNRHPNLSAATIRDPVSKKHHFNIVTHRQSTKGCALRSIVGKTDKRIIAAGDDRNDLSMFAEADLRIVMETAPKEILAVADIIAPSAAKHGIIEALEKAINL